MREGHVSIEIVQKKRWKAYAAAAAATLAAGGAENIAEASIFYSGIVNTNINNAIVPVAGLGSAPNPLGVARHVNLGGGYGVALFGVYGQMAGFQVGAFLYASNLAYGQQISVLANFNTPSYFNTMAYGGGYGNDQFLAAGQGYMAFRFNGGTQFGWARVTMAGAPGNTYVLNDYAYGSVGQAVRVGQILVDPVPEPATSLGALALGAAGVLAWRRARKQKVPA